MEGGFVSQSYCYTERSRTLARAPAYVVYDDARAGSWSRLTHAPDRPPALGLFTIPGSVSKEARTKMTSINGIPGRPAGWLADDGQTIGSVPDRRQRGI